MNAVYNDMSPSTINLKYENAINGMKFVLERV